jgi:hypothetical protein
MEVQENETQQENVQSPFVEIQDMDLDRSINIMIQAANAAQRAGALGLRDSVLVASAAEFLTKYNYEQHQKAVIAAE